MKPPGRLLRSVVMMFIGSSGAMVISSLSVLLITHFVGPEVYGIYQAVDALALVFAIGGTFAIDRAFFVSRLVGEDAQILAIGLVALLFSCGVAVAVFLGLRAQGWMLDGGLGWLVVAYLGLSILSRGMFAMGRSFEIRNSRYRVVNESEFARAVGLLLGRVAAAFLMPTLSGLLLSGIAGSLAGTFRINRALFAHTRERLRRVSLRRFRAVVHKHSRYLLIEGWGGFVRPLGQKGIIILVAPTFGASQAALASMAFLLLLQPLQIGVNAVVDVVRSRLGQVVRGQSGKQELRYARTMPLWVIGLTPVALVIGVLTIKVLSPLLLGPQWQSVSTVSAAMTPLVFALMVARALQSVYSQFARQDMALLLDTVTSLGSLALIAGFWALGMTIIETYVLTGLGLTLFVAAVLVHFFRWNARERS